MLDYQDLRDEFALGADSDPWGSAMEMWFCIAAEMWDRNLSIPSVWQYRPGPGIDGPKDPDSYLTPVLEQATDDALVRFGEVMRRYTSRLRHAGLDY